MSCFVRHAHHMQTRLFPDCTATSNSVDLEFAEHPKKMLDMLEYGSMVSKAGLCAGRPKLHAVVFGELVSSVLQ